MNVRAKFRCESKTLTSDGASIEFWPVTSGSPENEEFYKYTPTGKIELSTINLKAADAFEPGAEYYIDFSKAE